MVILSVLMSPSIALLVASLSMLPYRLFTRYHNRRHPLRYNSIPFLFKIYVLNGGSIIEGDSEKISFHRCGLLEIIAGTSLYPMISCWLPHVTERLSRPDPWSIRFVRRPRKSRQKCDPRLGPIRHPSSNGIEDILEPNAQISICFCPGCGVPSHARMTASISERSITSTAISYPMTP
jgi:hypothetical protein